MIHAAKAAGHGLTRATVWYLAKFGSRITPMIADDLRHLMRVQGGSHHVGIYFLEVEGGGIQLDRPMELHHSSGPWARYGEHQRLG
jgi:hypothetical protein